MVTYLQVTMNCCLSLHSTTPQPHGPAVSGLPVGVRKDVGSEVRWPCLCGPPDSLLLLKPCCECLKGILLFNSLGSCRIEANVLFLYLSCIFALARHFPSSLSCCSTAELPHWPPLSVLLVDCSLLPAAFLCCVGLTFPWDS